MASGCSFKKDLMPCMESWPRSMSSFLEQEQAGGAEGMAVLVGIAHEDAAAVLELD